MVPSFSRIKQRKKNSCHGRRVAMYRCSDNCCWIAEQVGDPTGRGMGGSSNIGYLQGHTSTSDPSHTHLWLS